MLKTQFDKNGFALIIADKHGNGRIVYTLDDAKGEPVRLVASLTQYINGKGKPQ